MSIVQEDDGGSTSERGYSKVECPDETPSRADSDTLEKGEDAEEAPGDWFRLKQIK